jgi:hypothetical protein
MHAIEVNSIALAREKKLFCLRRRVEIQIQLLPSPIRSDAFSARRANRLYCGDKAWPVVQRIENMMHFDVALMVNFRMRALDELLLFVDWD